MTPALTAGTKIGWATGSVGTVTLLYLVNLFLLFFLSDVLGIDPATAGLMLFAVRLYDMFTDPLVGYLSDRTQTRWGRRRPWLLAGAIASAVSCILMFSPPAWAVDSAQLPIYMVVALICYFTGYTAFNVPYLAMPAEMCGDYQERTSLMSYRVFFVALAGLLATAIAPVLVEYFGDGVAGFRGMAWIMAFVILAGMLVTVGTTAGTRFTVRETTELSVADSLRTIVANRPLLLLISIKFLQLFALACTSASLLFVVKFVIGQGTGHAGIFGLTLSIANIAALPLWMRISEKAPKHIVCAIASGGQALVALTWLLAGAEESIIVFGLRAAALGFFSAGIILMAQALLPDVIEYDYRLSGVRREGLLASLYSFVEKTSFAFSPLVIGPFLAFMGYQAGGDASAQPDSAFTAFYITIGVMPAASYLLSIPLLLHYRLTRAELESGNAPAS